MLNAATAPSHVVLPQYLPNVKNCGCKSSKISLKIKPAEDRLGLVMYNGGAHVMDFDWDEAKAVDNERKHGVAFAEAMTVFADTLSVTGHDTEHADDEERFLTMGISTDGRLLVVVHADRGDIVRMISARKATRRERRDYEDGNFP